MAAVRLAPIYAAIYQFVVLAVIFAASGLTSLVGTLLIGTHAFTDAEQLLRALARSPFTHKGEQGALGGCQ